MKTPNLMTGALCALLVLSSNELATAASPDHARAAIAEQSRAFMNALESGDAQGAARIFSADARLLVAMVDGAVKSPLAADLGRSLEQQQWIDSDCCTIVSTTDAKDDE